MQTWQKMGIALFAIAVTSVFFINYCNLIFQCGCTWLWAGADAHCNVHRAGLHRCPWCRQPAGILVWLIMVIPQAYISFRRNDWGWRKRLTIALLAFPVIGLVPAITLGLFTGYWN